MKLFFLFLIIFFSSFVYSQFSFQDAEREISRNCDYFINAENINHRTYAYDMFYSKLKEALNKENSFQYPFDSIKGVSILMSEDSMFRVFSWQFAKSFDDFEYGGIVQMNNGKVYILNDNKDFFPDLEYEVFKNDDWYGQLYYKLYTYLENNKKSYLLFGYKNIDSSTKMKVVSPIYFSDNMVYFGKEIFEDTLMEGGKKNRVVLSTSNSSASSMNYNESKNMIVYDHTITIMTPDRYGGKLTPVNVPDGSYHGYKWNGQYWEFVDKVFNSVYKEAPRPTPILNTKRENEDRRKK